MKKVASRRKKIIIQRPKKITYMLRTAASEYNGKKTPKVSALEIIPGLCVYRNSKYVDGWCIGHISSGLSFLMGIKTKQLAIRIIRKVLTELDWTVSREIARSDNKYKDAFEKARDFNKLLAERRWNARN